MILEKNVDLDQEKMVIKILYGRRVSLLTMSVMRNIPLLLLTLVSYTVLVEIQKFLVWTIFLVLAPLYRVILVYDIHLLGRFFLLEGHKY